MPILKLDGADIYYEVTNPDGKKVVTLVNGHTRSSSDFRMMARILGEAGFRVIILDNRAAGKSEAARPFTITDMCNDVVALWDHLKVKSSSLLGISMGGFISQGIAINFPDRVEKLTLVSTAPEEKYINPTGGGWINEGSKLEDKLRSYFAPGFVERNPVLFKTMVAQIRLSISSGNFSERSDLQRAALKNAGWSARLSEIRSDTLIIHGAKDLVIDQEGANLLRDSVPHARLEIIPEAGHLLLAEAPRELYRLALNFLSK